MHRRSVTERVQRHPLRFQRLALNPGGANRTPEVLLHARPGEGAAVGERGTIHRGRQASKPKLEHPRRLPPEWDPALFAPLAEDTNALTAIEVNVGNLQGGQLGYASACIVEGREEDMIPLAAPGLAKRCAKDCTHFRIEVADPKTNNRPFYVRVVEVPSTPLPSDPPW